MPSAQLLPRSAQLVLLGFDSQSMQSMHSAVSTKVQSQARTHTHTLVNLLELHTHTDTHTQIGTQHRQTIACQRLAVAQHNANSCPCQHFHFLAPSVPLWTLIQGKTLPKNMALMQITPMLPGAQIRTRCHTWIQFTGSQLPRQSWHFLDLGETEETVYASTSPSGTCDSRWWCHCGFWLWSKGMMKTTLSRSNRHSFALRKVKSIEKAAGKEISAVKGRSVGMV